MTISKALGTYGDAVGVVTPLDHKLAQLALISKVGAGTNAIRSGLLYDGVANIVLGKVSMSYDVVAFTAALSRGAAQGAVLLTNDGTVNVVTTAAPGANSRIDVIYVWPREFAIDGVDSTPVIAVVQGEPASSPIAPAIPAGALELARAVVPAGVTATDSGVTITQTAPFTALDGAPITVRTSSALPATAVPFARARTLDTELMYEFDGVAWGPRGNGYDFGGQVRYTASGTFLKANYPGLRAIRVRVQGGGASGSTTPAVATTTAASGASGTYAESLITDIAGLAASVAVTVGAGGAPDLVAGAAGNGGGQSSFGATTVAPGGVVNPSYAAIVSAAPVDGVGDIVIPGGGNSGGSATASLNGSAGGSCPLGIGGPGQTGGNSGPGRGYGSGGGGSAATSVTIRVGGAGAPGIVIVDLYY